MGYLMKRFTQASIVISILAFGLVRFPLLSFFQQDKKLSFEGVFGGIPNF